MLTFVQPTLMHSHVIFEQLPPSNTLATFFAIEWVFPSMFGEVIFQTLWMSILSTTKFTDMESFTFMLNFMFT